MSRLSAMSGSAGGRGPAAGARPRHLRLGLPLWMDLALVPVVNLLLALVTAAVVLALSGFDPFTVLGAMVAEALGSAEGMGRTLHLATGFTLTGLAVAIAWHAGVFNLGGEGQALLGGMVCAIVALKLGAQWPGPLVWPLMGLGAALGGAAWAAVPAALQIGRGVPVVLGSLLMSLLAPVLLVGLSAAPMGAAAPFPLAARLPTLHGALQALGLDWPVTPLNLTAVLAVAAVALSWAGLWRTRAGYELRVTGWSPAAARYAGVRPTQPVWRAMLISGALAGLAGMNALAAAPHRLTVDAMGGVGIAGVVVALVGRRHPLGVALAALLLAVVFAGRPGLTRTMPGAGEGFMLLWLGLVLVLAGALSHLSAPALAALHRSLGPMRLRASRRESE